MNEYSIIKQRQEYDKAQQKQNMQKQLGKLGKIGSGKGSYSSEYAKLHYRDTDLRRLANEGKGTTSSYNYS